MSLVTFSGGLGCGAEEVAQLVADGADLELYDDQRLQKEALNMGLRQNDLKGLDEKAPGFFDSLRYNPELYIDILESVVYEVSRSGKGVLIGHGSQLLLRDFGCALHVLIHPSEPFRIRQVMDHYGLSSKAAERMIRKSDNEKRGFLRFAFHMEWNDPSLYDLVISTEKLGTQGAAKLVLEALKSQAIQECSLNALGSMERMSLSKKVQAELLRQHFNLNQFHVEVPETGLVQLTGFTTSQDEKDRLTETAKKVPGVARLNAEVAVLQSGA
jgi:cytidylate kinase